MRSEVVELAGRHVIVDCYNANPGSMAAALRTLAELASPAEAGRGLAVLGDMLELGDHAAAAHREAGGLAAALGLGVVALGDWAEAVCAAAGGDAAAVREPAEAARLALARTAPGDWILVKASRGMRLERVVAAMQEAAT
jgi:UDP-N-acetylmuramyl pentapeptide synthase